MTTVAKVMNAATERTIGEEYFPVLPRVGELISMKGLRHEVLQIIHEKREAVYLRSDEPKWNIHVMVGYGRP